MLQIKSVKTIPAKAEHQCFILNGQKSIDAHPELANYKSYIRTKAKEKKSQIIRLIDGDTHLLAVIVFTDTRKTESSNNEKLRLLGNQIGQKLSAEKAKDVYINNGIEGLSEDGLLNLLEGMVLGNYQFLKYKSDKKANSLKTVNILGAIPKPGQISEMRNTVESSLTARDLINEPVITLNTTTLAKEISKISKKAGFKSKILNKAEITKLKMGGLLGVNMGSQDPPIFAITEWKPANAKNKKPYVLVGKGVVYDTGGYSIKTGPHMPSMKCDMSGAAAVIGTMMAVSKNKLPIHVIGLIPATDNRINSNSLVPDDIITMHDGTTVEVLNTDAEGRLILADALSYAKKYKPKLVIDLATLTGAVAGITGPLGTGMMGSADDKEKAALKESGDQVYERLFEMPFWEEYSDLLKSTVADLKNIGSGYGGGTTAGKFLEHFTDYPWIHLDIAGPAFIDSSDGYKSAGGTGVGVRMLYHFLKSKSGK